MDPFTLIGVAANLARVIIHLSYTYKLQQTHIGILIDRICSLEKPLETLERQGKNNANKISEHALQKLISTLESVQALITQHQKMDNKSKAKRFLFGDANMDDLKLIRERLDSSLLDLQLAITVEEAGNNEQRVHLTARATVDILMNSVTQRATEAILKCVQCNMEYRASENPVGSCKYHSSFPRSLNGWKYQLDCCGEQINQEEMSWGPECKGCTRGVHCDFQHTQYPYAAYYLWMRHQVYNNVQETWLQAKDWDYEDGIDKFASFGLSKDNLLFVTMGRGYASQVPLFLQYFDPNNMPTATATVGNIMTIAMRGTGITPGEIEKNLDDNRWVVDALWTLDDAGNINGIRLSASSCSSKQPIIKELPLSFNPLTKGTPRLLSHSLAPTKAAFTDPLPNCITDFVPFPDTVFQEPPLEPTYETVNSGTMQVRLKKSAPADANPETSGFGHDVFVVPLYVMNLSQGATLGSSSEERMIVLNLLKEGKMQVEEAIKLLSTLDSSPHQHGSLTFIDCRARIYVNDRWVNAADVKMKIKKDDKMIPGLPFEVAPRGAQKVVVECVVDAPEKKLATAGWFHRAFVSRIAPVTIEVQFEEMSGQTTTIMTQFSNPAFRFPGAPDNHLYWIYCDSLERWDRNHITVLPPDPKVPESCFELSLNGSRRFQVTFKDLMRWGYLAVKANTSIYEIKDNQVDNQSMWALVDLNAEVCCGLKLQVRIGDSVNEGIWMIPEDLLLASRKHCLGDDADASLYQPQPPPSAAKAPARGLAPRTAPRHEPPANPPPPTPTTEKSNPPPSAQPPTSPPTAAPNSAPPATAPRTNSGFVRTMPTPPPRTPSQGNGIAKSSSNGSIAPPPANGAPSPSPSPSPSPAPSTSSPAPASPSLSSAAPTQNPSASVPTVVTPSNTSSYVPPPISPKPAAPASPVVPKMGELALKCQTCSFGTKKDECIKCKANVPPGSNPPPGIICKFCAMNTLKGKCVQCNNILIAGKSVTSVTCMKCSFGANKDKCIKCNKVVNN